MRWFLKSRQTPTQKAEDNARTQARNKGGGGTKVPSLEEKERAAEEKENDKRGKGAEEENEIGQWKMPMTQARN